MLLFVNFEFLRNSILLVINENLGFKEGREMERGINRAAEEARRVSSGLGTRPRMFDFSEGEEHNILLKFIRAIG